MQQTLASTAIALMAMGVCLLAAAATVHPANAQVNEINRDITEQSTAEITGTVNDSFGAPIDGATIYINPPGTSIAMVLPGGVSVETDATGRFRAKLKTGMWLLRVAKEGFRRLPGDVRDGTSDGAQVELSEDKPLAQVQFTLTRSSVLKGRIVDFETKEPLPDIWVEVRPYVFQDGQPALFGISTANGSRARTGPDGTFAATLGEGRYVVEVGGDVASPLEVIYPAPADSLDDQDPGYVRTYLPAGAGFDTALPITVGSAAIVDVGEVALRREQLARVRVDIDTSTCRTDSDGAPIHLQMYESNVQSRQPRILTDIPCGPFLFPHKQPGEYELAFYEQVKDQQRWGLVRFTVGSENVNVPMVMTGGGPVEGKVVLADAARDLELTQLTVSLSAIGMSLGDEFQPHRVSEKGEFQFSKVFAGAKKLRVEGLGTDDYVREVRYNQLAQYGPTFEAGPYGVLEIEIDRGAAAISGSVMANNKKVPNAEVVIIRRMQAADGQRTTYQRVKADAEGTYQLKGLVPGEYRVFAVAAEDNVAAQNPIEWQRLTQQAERIVLDRGARAVVALDVKRLAR